MSKSISPIDLARKLYEGGPRDFAADLEDHMQKGYVFVWPDLFAMFTPVQLDDLRVAWHIGFVIGAIADLALLFPYPLPWISFRRVRQLGESPVRADCREDYRRLRVYPFDRFTELARKFQNRCLIPA